MFRPARRPADFGDGWAGPLASSGSQTVSETAQNLYSYAVSCGAPPLNATSFVSVNSCRPGLLRSRQAQRWQVGQSVTLTWLSMDGSSCTASGGTTNDGWAASRPSSGSFQVRENVPGTYTYTLICGTAPDSSVMISFSAPSSVPLPAPPPSVQLAQTLPRWRRAARDSDLDDR